MMPRLFGCNKLAYDSVPYGTIHVLYTNGTLAVYDRLQATAQGNPLYIGEWQWDDGNLDELARHGLHPRIVYQVSEGSPKFRRNKRNRAASHQMIGPDRGGALWVLCIVELAGQPGVWRAITG